MESLLDGQVIAARAIRRRAVTVALLLGLVVAACVVFVGADRAQANAGCANHWAHPYNCPLVGNLSVQCSGATLRYDLSTASANHGSPSVGTYNEYAHYHVGQSVDGSGFCLGRVSSRWLLTDSGWVSYTVSTENP